MRARSTPTDIRAYTFLAALIVFALAGLFSEFGPSEADADNRNRYVPTPYARPVIDANAMGAIPDDGLSDTEAIQKALDAANAAGGGTVFLKPGRYELTWEGAYTTTWEGAGYTHKAALKSGSNTEISAVGAVLALANRADCILLTNSDWINGNSNITVTGGEWDGTLWKQFQYAKNTAQGGAGPYWNGHGVVFVSVDRLLVQNAKFVNHTKYALMVQGCTRWAVNNTDYATDSDGTHIGGPSFMGRVQGWTGTCRAAYWKVSASGGSGTFTRGELITHSNGATGYYISESGGFVTIRRLTGTFVGSGTITGVGGATRNATAITFTLTYDNNIPIISDEDPVYYNNYAAPWVRLTVAGTTGLFELGETVTQAGSGATGTVKFESLEDGYLYVVATSGTFNGSGTVTGTVATRTVSAVAQTSRPVNSILISDYQAAPTGTGQPFRLSGHAEDIMSDITYQNVKGKVVYGDGFTFGDDVTGGAALLGSIQKRIKCVDVALQLPTGSNVFNITGSGVKSIDIDGLNMVNPKANAVYCNNGSAGGSLVMDSLGIRNVKTNGTDRAVFTIASGATVNKLSLHNVEGVMSNDAGSNAGTIIGVSGTVGDIQHSNWNVTSTVTGAVKGIVISGGTVNSIVGFNTSMSGPNVNFLEYTSTGTITKFGSWSNTIWTLTGTTTGKHLVMVSGTPTQRLSFNNITLTGTSATNLSYGWQIDSTNVQYINVSNLFSTGAWLYTFSVGGTAGLLVSNISNWTLWDTTGLKAQNDSTVRMNINGMYHHAAGTAIDCGAGGGTATNVFLSLSNVVYAGSANFLKAQTKCTVVCNLSGFEMPSGTSGTAFLTASAASGNPGDLRITGAGAVTVTAGTLINRQTGTVNGILRVNHPDFKCDAAVLTGTQGDRVWSTTTGGALLPATAGPAVCELGGAPATADWDKSGRAF